MKKYHLTNTSTYLISCMREQMTQNVLFLHGFCCPNACLVESNNMRTGKHLKVKKLWKKGEIKGARQIEFTQTDKRDGRKIVRAPKAL